MRRFLTLLKTIYRETSGDNAYARYRDHHAAHHPGQPPLSRADFFRARMERKWQGINRCC